SRGAAFAKPPRSAALGPHARRLPALSTEGRTQVTKPRPRRRRGSPLTQNPSGAQPPRRRRRAGAQPAPAGGGGTPQPQGRQLPGGGVVGVLPVEYIWAEVLRRLDEDHPGLRDVLEGGDVGAVREFVAAMRAEERRKRLGEQVAAVRWNGRKM